MITRRFVCEVPHCRRRIFAERFGDDVVPIRARRTARLECIVHHLGLALGGRPAAGFAQRLMLPVSNDTLLRVVRRRAVMPSDPLIVVGIDDWAFRRNHRYGTIVCDLERRRIVALLPNRETATVQAWLSGHPGIKIVSRDRGGGYGEAVTRAIPEAIQVADRWHLMENASAAFLDAVRRSMRGIRSAIGATTINPALLTSAERLRYQGYLRRREAHGAIVALVSTRYRSKRSSVGQGTAVTLSARSVAAGARMSFGPARARSTATCRSWRRNGRAGVATAPNSGVG
jgi:transposase